MWSGSSPRVRGTVWVDLAIAADERFIPARAGNSWQAQRNRPRPAVHPRACGEQFGSLAWTL